MKAFVITLLLLGLANTAIAQERPDPENPGPNLEVPTDWRVVLDRPSDDVVISADEDDADIWFVNMKPGWHITSGPAAIYFHPGSMASGDYRAELAIHLFDPGQRQREAFGLFIGGTDLEADARAYDYFLLRNTGEYLIKRRSGAETSTLQGWTASEAIVVFDDSAESSVLNTLAVEVRGDTATFFVNDTEVAQMPAADLQTEGVVGLRINHGLNVHVEGFTVTPLAD